MDYCSFFYRELKFNHLKKQRVRFRHGVIIRATNTTNVQCNYRIRCLRGEAYINAMTSLLASDYNTAKEVLENYLTSRHVDSLILVKISRGSNFKFV